MKHQKRGMSIWEVYEPVLEGVEIAEDVRKNEIEQ
jgi:hypothetical protein